MCIGGSQPKQTPTPPPPPAAPPPPPPNVLQPAQDSGKGLNPNGAGKGRKSLRIDLATSTVAGSSGLNLPTGG